MKYFEKLQDPRWQKLRLQVFERDKWACVSCGDKSKPLHVHHSEYHHEPWDSPEDELATLCEDCHSGLEEAIKMLRKTPQIQAMKHIVARTIMVHDRSPADTKHILKFAIKLCETLDERKKPAAA